MNRLPDWRSRLSETVDAWRARPLDYQDTNCGFFAADCVAAMTGHDLVAPLRNKGLDIVEGVKALRAAGHRDAVEFAAAHLSEISPSRARTGDLVAVEAEFGIGEEGLGTPQSPVPNPLLALGVVAGSLGEIAVMHPQGGIGFVPFDRAKRAFRIGTEPAGNRAVGQ